MTGYDIVGYNAVDATGIPYYHTNVIMHVGQSLAIICTESMIDRSQQNHVNDHLKMSDKEIIDLSRDQIRLFAGNMLEVKGDAYKASLIMSEAAYQSLHNDQLCIIKNHNIIVTLSIPTIEYFDGGSVRCMMAEIF